MLSKKSFEQLTLNKSTTHQRRGEIHFVSNNTSKSVSNASLEESGKNSYLSSFSAPRQDIDVVPGRGEKAKRYNGHYLELVHAFAPGYQQTQFKNPLKRLMAKEIYCRIKSKDGRFLEEDPECKEKYKEMNENDAIRKIMKALKDCNKTVNTGKDPTPSIKKKGPKRPPRQYGKKTRNATAWPEHQNKAQFLRQQIQIEHHKSILNESSSSSAATNSNPIDVARYDPLKEQNDDSPVELWWTFELNYGIPWPSFDNLEL